MIGRVTFAVALLATSLVAQVPTARTFVEQPAGLLPPAGSYRLEWKRHFDRQTGIEAVAGGSADHSGALWLITREGRGKLQEFLAKIDPNGELVGKYDPHVPLKPIEWIAYLSPAASGNSIGLLASLASGGRDQTFEGAFFMPFEANGLGAPKRVAGQGPQFPTLVGAGSGQFIAAGDQAPLTLLKLDSTGSVLWKRAFSRRLVLPEVSVNSDGEVFVLSQGGRYLLLQVLDAAGGVRTSKQIAARQGTIAADPRGGCSILFSKGLGGQENRVYLLTFDQALHQLHQTETPLRGPGGRTYQLITTPQGHLAIGEGPRQGQNIAADFDGLGNLRWQRVIPGGTVPLLLSFPSGFYVVRDSIVRDGTDIEKYLYR
jgi:hypothetical protein